MSNNYVKTPSGLLDYTWDWTDWLADISDTIDTATVTVPVGLTAVGEAVVDNGYVTQEVSGGTLNVTYTMVCQITTGGGLVDERNIYLKIANR